MERSTAFIFDEFWNVDNSFVYRVLYWIFFELFNNVLFQKKVAYSCFHGTLGLFFIAALSELVHTVQ